MDDIFLMSWALGHMCRTSIVLEHGWSRMIVSEPTFNCHGGSLYLGHYAQVGWKCFHTLNKSQPL